ncbi:alpha/beta hydrolase [Thalassorhabdomicrobium marinisediminis]|uniref:alpha/beta hydrolase n=1 Tax=Thalassorhabdomicrobium marinisediminis TaxID=2170577 RepID=UPI0024910F0C|nr:alpha/beta hydrolase [Thalassorhabdomicrobium marinisediminis]
MTREQADDAYANSKHIPDGEAYLARWEATAQVFRDHHRLKELNVPYGPDARQTYDIFHPERLAKGTVVFLHGGYWMAGAPGMFSHLATGALGAGFACAMPGYTLAPEARIGDIVHEVAMALEAIARCTAGPIYLVGHSAGGHLAARMACVDMMAEWSVRLARIVPISPLSDLEPLRATSMNDTLRIDAKEARAESPVHHVPQEVPVTVWVGGAERPAFLQQAHALAKAWGCGHVVEPERHHFDVIEGLERPDSALMQTLLA